MKAPNQRGIQGVKHPYYSEAFAKQHIRDLREIPDHPIVLYYSFFMHTIKTLKFVWLRFTLMSCVPVRFSQVEYLPLCIV